MKRQYTSLLIFREVKGALGPSHLSLWNVTGTMQCSEIPHKHQRGVCVVRRPSNGNTARACLDYSPTAKSKTNKNKTSLILTSVLIQVSAVHTAFLKTSDCYVVMSTWQTLATYRLSIDFVSQHHFSCFGVTFSTCISLMSHGYSSYHLCATI